jgi:hypothetical protein
MASQGFQRDSANRADPATGSKRVWHKARSILSPRITPLTWRQTITRFSYYSLGIAALWALAFVLYLLSGVMARPGYIQPLAGSVEGRVNDVRVH